MEMKLHFKSLPAGMALEDILTGLDGVLEEDGNLTGSHWGPEGGFIELELEDEYRNPKYGILAVKHYLQSIQVPGDTAMELAGLTVGIYE